MSRKSDYKSPREVGLSECQPVLQETGEEAILYTLPERKVRTMLVCRVNVGVTVRNAGKGPIMVGVQGSGKTTFGEQVLTPMGYTVQSRDKLGATKARFNKLITQAVSQYDRVAIDATNGKLETRQELYKIASEHGMRVIVLYFLRNGKDWNSLREGKAKIHPVAIHGYYKHMIPPTVGEGGENLPERVVPISHWTYEQIDF